MAVCSSSNTLLSAADLVPATVILDMHVDNQHYKAVPCAQRHVQARVRRLQSWAGMPCNFSCTYVLDPQDPLFDDVGTAFVRVRTSVFAERCPELHEPADQVRNSKTAPDATCSFLKLKQLPRSLSAT